MLATESASLTTTPPADPSGLPDLPIRLFLMINTFETGGSERQFTVLAQGGDQRAHIVTIHIADVFEPKLIDQRAGQDGGGDGIFHCFGRVMQSFSDRRN